MKKQTLYSFAMSVLVLFLWSLPASAQSSDDVTTYQIPFQFQVGEKLLPAGQYLIKRNPQMPQMMLIHCLERKLWVAVQTIPRQLPEYPNRSSLIFKKYDGAYFLTEVKVLGHGNGYALIKSKTERKLVQMAETKTIRAIHSDAGQTTGHD